MPNPTIPTRDLYGIASDDILRGDSPYEAIQHHINSYGLDTEDETMTLVCANWQLNEHGQHIETESGDAFEIKDVVELKINVREWCQDNDAMELLEK